MLRAGCIKSYQREDGETLISVMSRHTLPDGRTSDPDITEGSFDKHWPELGPDLKAIGGYYRREIDWEQFRKLYFERLASNGQSILKLAELARLAEEGDVAVLCVEPEPDHCHRRLLLGYFGLYYPNIGIQLG